MQPLCPLLMGHDTNWPSEMIAQELIEILREHFSLDWRGIHGAPHWARVRENGLQLAKLTGASMRVVEAFAFVHDSCRLSDGSDPDHGLRAAKFARYLVEIEKLPLAPDELKLLELACEHHSSGRTVGDITICTCWDSDRLDLGRVGVLPRPEYLCTAPAKNPSLIKWAYERSIKP
jgi:uncharacterized protein